MRDTLYIRLRDVAPTAPTAHALVASSVDGTRPDVFVRTAPLSEVIALGVGRRVVVFVPSADVRLTSITVPARQPAKILAAAPYVLEDQLADDVETLHFALGSRLPGGAHAIAIVAQQRMAEWLAPFVEQGVRINAMVPETLALPWLENGPISVLPDDGQMIVRNGACSGFSCVAEDLELFLQLAQGDEQRPLRIIVTRDDDRDYTKLERPVELIPGFADPLEALVRSWTPAQSIELLQGQYSQREDLDRFWRPWKLAAQLAAAAILIGVAANAVDAFRLKRQVDAQQAANETQFHSLFPRETRIVDLQAQLDQQLRALRASAGGGSLFQLMQSAAMGLAATPGLTLKGAQFREGALYLDLSGTDLQVLERLRSWFAGHHSARLEVQTADAGESGVQIRLKLTPGAST